MAVQSRSIDSHRLQSTVLWNNIPAALVYRVYISQLIRYSRTSGAYDDIRDRVLLHDLVNRCEISVSQSTRIYSVCRNHNPVLSSIMTFQRVCNKTNTTCDKCGAGITYPSEALEPTPGFSGVCVSRSFDRLVDDCLTFVCHCIVCPCSIYCSRLPLWYLQIFTV